MIKDMLKDLFHPHKKYDEEAEKIKTRIQEQASQTEEKIVILNKVLKKKSTTYHIARALGVIP